MTLRSSGKHTLVVVSLFASGFMIKACKPGNNSETASIDNFASANADQFTLNDCQPYTGDHLNDTVISNDIAGQWVNDKSRIELRGISLAEVEIDLKTTLSLVPYYILEPLYKQTKTKIYVMDDATEACGTIAKANDAERINKPFNCWAQSEKDADYNGFIFSTGEITAGKSINARQAIRHGMIRSMAYYYFHVTLDSIDAPAIKAWVDQLKPFEPTDTKKESDQPNIGRKMFVAFENDLKAKGTSLEKLGLGVDSLALRKAIFVEALDSVYCSEATFKKFTSEFPNLYGVYAGQAAVKPK